jgi:hypothetical protein
MEQNPFEKPTVPSFLMETADSLLCAQEPIVGQNILGDQAKQFVTWKSISFFKTYRNILDFSNFETFRLQSTNKGHPL